MFVCRMAAYFSARVAADLSELAGLSDRLEAFLEQAGLPTPAIIKLQLALDEIGANIVHHAYDEAGGWLELAAQVTDEVATITFRDAGRPFDPTTLADPDTSAALEDRQIGGLGIMLVRRLMDSVVHSRTDGINQLTITLAAGP